MKHILLYLILFFSSVDGFSNEYLLEEHNISAERFSKSPYATKFQVLSQLLESSKTAGFTLDITFENHAKEFIDTYEYNNTEFLSRKIIVNALYGNEVTALQQQLLSSQNPNGGWGELLHFTSSVVDTAFALKALSFVQENKTVVTNAATFLMSQQQNDGSWNDNEATNSTYLTALAMHSLWLVRNNVDVELALEKAQHYLESVRESDGLWSEHFQSALSIIAIAPILSDNSSLQQSINALEHAQLINQSWENDPYTTALVLQAIAIASKETPNPDLGTIRGTIVDGESGVALVGATIVLSSSDGNETQYSQNNGSFVFSAIAHGEYDLTITKENFLGLQSKIIIDSSAVHLGTIHLNRSSNADVASIKGVVSDIHTHVALPNAKVTINGSTVFTNSSGEYQITNIQAGIVNISIESEGYLLSQKELTVTSGFTLQYSVALTSIESINATTNAVVQGIIVDSATNEYLENIKVTLRNSNIEKVIYSTQTGTFLIPNLHVGNYNIIFEKAGYQSIQGTFTISTTQTIDFGIIKLSVDDPEAIKVTTVKGMVSDAITKEPIVGALINIAGSTTLSAVDGSYTISDLPEGLVTLNVTKEGYKNISVQTTLTQGNTLIFSPAMIESRQSSLKMYGTILDANRSAPLQDVNITISGNSSATVFTDSSGNYLIEPLNKGELHVVISKNGYQTIVLNAMVEESNIEFSPLLYSDNGIVNGTSMISGSIVDISTSEPISDVHIFVNGNNSGVVSDVNGSFVLNGIEDTDLNITLQKDQYKDIDLMFVFATPQQLDVGELKMRSVTVDDLRPDLVVEMINTGTLLQDTQTLSVTGEINITIANRGTVTAQSYDVIAFYDTDADGNFTKESDLILSEKRIENSLEVNALNNLLLDINNTADFRDQPLYIYVDARNENIELNEINNLYSTATSCGGKQGSIDLAVCFDYSGSVGYLANMQKEGLISALRDPEKFPRDGSIRLMIMTAANRTYLEPIVINQSNAESIADTLSNQYFFGNSYVDYCLRYAADKLASLDTQSSYKAITLSGDGYWGGSVAYYRDYAVSKGVDVIDVIGIGRLNWSTLNSIVYPQPAGGEFGVINVATTSEEVSESLVRAFKKQTAISDLTVGKLEVIDHGVDANVSISFKVGNAGVAFIPNTVTISVYEGNPESDGILLKSVILDQNISAGHFIEMTIDNISLQEGGELYVIGDIENQLVECTKQNNSIAAILQSTTTLGTVAASTDRDIYGANKNVNLSATVTNPGRLSYALHAQLEIFDNKGILVENFPVVDLGVLASGEEKKIAQPWNTTTLLSGAYMFQATLLDRNGNVVDQSTASFNIAADSNTTALASLRLEPNKSIYHTTDTLFLESLIENLSLNNIVHNATLELRAQHRQNGDMLFEQNSSMVPLAPEAMRRIPFTVELHNALQGEYTLFGRLIAQDGSVLAQDSVHFEIQSNLSVSLLGDVKVAFSTIEQGDEQRCIYSIKNFSANRLSNQPIRHTLVNLESGQSIMQDELSLTIDVNKSILHEQYIDTSTLKEGEYTCILQAQKNERWRNVRIGEWKGLASATFTVGDRSIPTVVAVPFSDTFKTLLWVLMLGAGIFYLRNYYRRMGAKK